MEQKTKQLSRGTIWSQPRAKPMSQPRATSRGFTLLELLIVIGILAILATAAVLVLNPAELLRQARDSTRASDLASLNSTLGLYLSTVASPSLDNRTASACKNGASTTLMVYSAMTGATTSVSTYTNAYITNQFAVYYASTIRKTDGSGWLPVDLTQISGGAPLSNWPVDPSNSSTTSAGMLNYTYGCDSKNNTYVLTAKFESMKYNVDMGLPSKDGGPDAGLYEVGNAPGLQL